MYLAACVRTQSSLLSIIHLNWHTNIGILYYKEITTISVTTTTATTANSKVNTNSGPRRIIEITEQGRKYKYILRRQGWYMQSQVSVIKLLARAGNFKLGAKVGK